jgi:SDR family mycofactocin-dependent oxidoreductase
MGVLEGKVAFITGAARGQGRAHAIKLAEEGADIVGLDICAQIHPVPYPMATHADLKETARLVEQTGRSILAEVADVRDRAQLQRVFDNGRDAFGHIDVVCANAGIMLSGTTSTDEELAWQTGLDVLLTGVWHTVQVAIPHLTERKQGCIIAISSTAGLKGFTDGRGGTDAYTAAKTAIVGLVKAYAAYLGPHNVRINAVAPTGVATPMVLEHPTLFDLIAEHPHLQQSMTNALPVQLIQPEDVSAVVTFLASDAGRYITGSTIAVDAGALVH